MLKKIAHFIAQQKLLEKDKKYIVALSGGADSVCLLLVLQKLGYDIEAAHCNFKLRGTEADRDEQFCIELCKKHDIKIHLAHFDTNFYAISHKISIEMAARELRYSYFENLRRDICADAVCVAHHQNDCAETVILNLIRGTGIHGLAGIQSRRDNIIRPLLCVSRDEIECFLKEEGQEYMTDSTSTPPLSTVKMTVSSTSVSMYRIICAATAATEQHRIRNAALFADMRKPVFSTDGSRSSCITA